LSRTLDFDFPIFLYFESHMAGTTNRQSKSLPTWTDVKAKLTDFDRAGLLDLIQSLYSAHKDNQVLREPGAPLDNNLAERALKKAILHQKKLAILQDTKRCRLRRSVYDPDPYVRAERCESLRLPH
jgi:hypothetical protein